MKKNHKKYIILFITILIILLLFIFIALITNKSDKKANNKDIIDSKTKKIINKINNNEEVMIYITDELDNCIDCKFGDINMNYYNNQYDLNIPVYNQSKDKGIEYILKALKYNENNIHTPALLHSKSGIITSHNEVGRNKDDIKKVLIETKYIDENSLDSSEIMIDQEEFKKLIAESKNNLFLLLAVNKKSYELRITMNNIAKKYNINYYVIDFSKSSVFSILDQLEKINNKNLPKEIFITNNNKIIASIEGKNKNKIEEFIKEYIKK